MRYHRKDFEQFFAFEILHSPFAKTRCLTKKCSKLKMMKNVPVNNHKDYSGKDSNESTDSMVVAHMLIAFSFLYQHSYTSL